MQCCEIRLDRSILLDATLFYIDWVNPQYYQRDQSGLVQFIDNVGGVESQGLEMTFQYRPAFVPGASLIVNLARIDTVTTTPFTTAAGDNPPPGSPWPNSPELQVSTTLNYVRDFDGDRGPVGLNAFVRHTYSSLAWSNLDYTAPTMKGATYDAGLAVDLPALRGAPRVAITLTHLTNKLIRVGDSRTSEILILALNRPPSIQLRLSGSF